jgi:Tol biopolymer transport system component
MRAAFVRLLVPVATAAALLVGGGGAQARVLSARAACAPIPLNGFSEFPSLSADGRVVAYSSYASNLVPGDTNGVGDVFVRAGGGTERVSVGPDGRQADGNSVQTALSTDGRYVAFVSKASNLVDGDTNRSYDVFVRDRRDGTVRRVSIGPRWQQTNADSYAPLISGDGRWVVFGSHSTAFGIGGGPTHARLYLRDLQAGSTRQIALGLGGAAPDDEALPTGLSADGRYLAFQAAASNLVTGDINATADIFVEDLTTNQVRRVNLDADGRQLDGASGGGALSADGTHLAYITNARQIDPRLSPDVFALVVRDLTTGHDTVVDINRPDGQVPDLGLALDAHGRTLAWAASTNPPSVVLTYDVFVADLTTGIRQQLTHSTNLGHGGSLWPQLSADGNHLVLLSDTPDLVPHDTNNQTDVFLASHLFTRHEPPTFTVLTVRTNCAT